MACVWDLELWPPAERADRERQHLSDKPATRGTPQSVTETPQSVAFAVRVGAFRVIRWRSRAGARGGAAICGLTWGSAVFATRVAAFATRVAAFATRVAAFATRVAAFVMVWKNTTVHSWGEPAPFLWVDLGFCGFYLPDVSSLHGLPRSG